MHFQISDAIEKFRYVANTSEPDKIVESDRKLEIHMETNKQDMKLIIQDKGIGMTKEELLDSLGTIAKSGSKSFMQQLKDSQQAIDTNIIGQFGVGFYSVNSKKLFFSRINSNSIISYLSRSLCAQITLMSTRKLPVLVP